MGSPEASTSLATRLPSMLGSLWNRLVRGRRDAAIDREVEKDTMSPEERHFAEESVEDMQADEFTGEHLGGISPERLLDVGEPPPAQDEPPQG